jgi:hypothetical protein
MRQVRVAVREGYVTKGRGPGPEDAGESRRVFERTIHSCHAMVYVGAQQWSLGRYQQPCSVSQSAHARGFRSASRMKTIIHPVQTRFQTPLCHPQWNSFTIARSRRSCWPWACPPVRPNSGPHERLLLNLAARVETGSIDGRRSGGMAQTVRRPSRVFETASPGPSNRGKSRPGEPHPRSQDRYAAARQRPLTLKNSVRNAYGPG